VTVAGHRAIFEAIRQGNSKLARRKMKEHLSSGLALLRPDPSN
jgi:DNA-binding GntR family transcriptional regulator